MSDIPSGTIPHTQIAGLEEAMARIDAHATQQADEEAYARGRADAVAILSSEAAEGREALALELAADASMKPERAETWLGKAEKKAPEANASEVIEQRKERLAAMDEDSPEVEASPGFKPGSNEERRAGLVALTKKLSEAR